jgi:hypothetical protein
MRGPRRRRQAGADLARLAAELGFADQSHLYRVVADETGLSVGLLRTVVA